MCTLQIPDLYKPLEVARLEHNMHLLFIALQLSKLNSQNALPLYGPPPSADACEVVFDAADVEERVNVVEPCPSLGLLVTHWVSHFVLLPAQPSQRVVPARLTLKQMQSAIL